MSQLIGCPFAPKPIIHIADKNAVITRREPREKRGASLRLRRQLGARRCNVHYAVISCDGHAGAATPDYRSYLPQRLHDEFDRWWAVASTDDGLRVDKNVDVRNFDLDVRFRDLEADGVIAEVIYPNTLTPFSRGTFNASKVDMEAVDPTLRWEGLRAYNRWVADWSRQAPHRLAAMAQISLHHIEESAAEIRWARDAGLRAGVMLPGIAPGSSLPPYHDPVYEPMWRACEECEMPVNHHGGSAAPHYGTHPGSTIIFLAEVGWFSHRVLTFLILGGVFERHPNLKLVMSEQGAGWVPGHLDLLDRYAPYGSLTGDPLGGAHLKLTPSEYYARNVFVGASFLAPPEVDALDRIGVDRLMWGSDYPHREGTFPYSRESLRFTFAGVAPDVINRLVSTNAATLYGFDLDALLPLAARVGPTVDEIAQPLTELPTDSGSPAFDTFAGAR
jgi:predicted TIM-barrel fold metal-dependent hydrolase